MSNKNPSATKKGPGRYHKEGHQKASPQRRRSGQFRRAAVSRQTSQVDGVTNTPLKAATRGG